MPTDGTVQLPPDSTGKKLDTSEIVRTDGTVVERERVTVSDDTLQAAVAAVISGIPSQASWGLVVRDISARLLVTTMETLTRELKRNNRLLEFQNGITVGYEDID